jgi:hypothetical protein
VHGDPDLRRRSVGAAVQPDGGHDQDDLHEDGGRGAGDDPDGAAH